MFVVFLIRRRNNFSLVMPTKEASQTVSCIVNFPTQSDAGKHHFRCPDIRWEGAGKVFLLSCRRRRHLKLHYCFSFSTFCLDAKSGAKKSRLRYCSATQPSHAQLAPNFFRLHNGVRNDEDSAS